MNSQQKFIVLFFGFIFLFFIISFGDAQDFWQATNGPLGQDINALAVNTVGNIFAGTNGNGIYRSLDNGNTWNQINEGLTKKTVYSLAINSSNYIFAGTNLGIFLSMDNGDNWTDKGISSLVRSIAINPGGHIFAGSNGVYRSTTNGDNWTTNSFGPYSPTLVFALAINSSWHIFAGLEYYLFRSTDNGGSWESLIWKGSNAIICSKEYVFVGREDAGIFRSIDNGNSWIEVNNGLINTDIRSFSISSSGDIFAGTYGGGVYRSTNNGDNWSSINTGLTNPFVLALTITPSGHLLAGSWGNGVFRSVQPVQPPTSVEEDEQIIPKSYVLNQNYPNPFNPVTNIEYQLPKDSYVTLRVFNIKGELVKTCTEEKQSSGHYKIQWDSRDENGNSVTAGLYIYQLKASDFSQSNKMVLVR